MIDTSRQHIWERDREIPVDADRARLRQMGKLAAAIRRAQRGEDLHLIALSAERIALSAERIASALERGGTL